MNNLHNYSTLYIVHFVRYNMLTIKNQIFAHKGCINLYILHSYMFRRPTAILMARHLKYVQFKLSMC
jgi:hypothetical protein